MPTTTQPIVTATNQRREDAASHGATEKKLKFSYQTGMKNLCLHVSSSVMLATVYESTTTSTIEKHKDLLFMLYVLSELSRLWFFHIPCSALQKIQIGAASMGNFSGCISQVELIESHQRTQQLGEENKVLTNQEIFCANF